MFNFFKNKQKKIDTENIRNYNEAIKTIKFFIATLEWEKWSKAIAEVLNKELSSYKDVINKIDESWDNLLVTKEKSKITAKYSKKQKELNRLKNKLETLKSKYDTKREKERFEVRFKTIKQEIEHLSQSWKANQWLKLLSKFLEENPWNSLVINFYNKEKKSILKQISKEKEKDTKKLKQNAKLDALKLIGQTTNLGWEDEDKVNKDKNESFFKRLKTKLNFYKKIKKQLEKKKLLDEINLLIEEEDKVKNDIAKGKLENMHRWLIKEIARDWLLWYDLYWKILWAHKISGDTFWFNEAKNKYTFFIWDATGHWIKAWFIITLLTRFFNQFIDKKSFKELIYEINNWLKQDLKSMNFITWIFFEVFKEDLNKINFIWLWHEPIMVYRAKTWKVERIIPWWLAAWIRLIKDPNDIKVKWVEMAEDDILLTYSDWIVETKSIEWKFYWMDKLEETFKKISTYEKDIEKIYKHLIEDAKLFRSGSNFDDDLTLLILKRNIDKDKIADKVEFLEEIWEKGKLSNYEIKRLKGTTKTEIQKEIEELKKEKQLKNIVKQLEQLWLTWEILKLKSEATRFIKAWNIHPKINYYLRKAIDNQQQYKISLKEDRIQNKYNVMKELMKKWDYSTVISEAEDIISKDWSI